MFSPSLSMNACVLKTFNLKIFGLTPLHPPKLYELHKLSLSQHLMKKIPISKVLVICRQDAVGAENLKCHKRSQSTTLTRLSLLTDDKTQRAFTCSKSSMEILKKCEKCLKLTIKIPEHCNWRRSVAFNVIFEHILSFP